MQTKQENQLEIKNDIGTAGYARTVGEDGKSYRTGISALVEGVVGGDVEELEEDVASLKLTVEEHTADIQNNTDDISDLQTTTSSHSTSIGNLQTAVGTNTTNISNLQSTVSGHTTSIGNLQTAVETNTGDITNLKEDLNELRNDVFEIENVNYIELEDVAETIESGITYSLTDNYLEVDGTTSAAVTKYFNLKKNIPAGSYYFSNFFTYAPGIINGTFNLVTTDNQFIALTGANATNLAVTIPEGKEVNRLSMYFGANRLETSTYKFCLTDYELPTPLVYPTDTFELSEVIIPLLDERYDKDAIEPTRVVCWGDSLTDGAPTYSYPSALQTLITNGGNSLNVENGGQGGETSLQISFRQGSIVLQANPTTIPSSGGVTLDVDKWNGKDIEILTRGGAYVTYDNPHLLINPASIKGVAGTLLRNSDGDIVFTRSASGTSETFDRPQDIIVKAKNSYNLLTDITVFWVGTNDTLWGIDQTITTIQNMIATLANDKYIVVGLTAKVHFSDITDRNFALANAFGKHFINVRDYILEYGLDDSEITPTAQDLTDIANGEIPTSLRVDTIHLNEDGYNIVANLIYQKGKELGYWI